MKWTHKKNAAFDQKALLLPGVMTDRFVHCPESVNQAATMVETVTRSGAANSTALYKRNKPLIFVPQLMMLTAAFL